MNLLKIAFRSLCSTPGPTLVVLATLALALGANAAIFSLVQGVLLRPLGYGDDERVVVLWGTHDGGEDLFRLSPADYRDLRDGVDAFGGDAAIYRSIGSTLTSEAPATRVGTMAVTARLFQVLDAQPAVGRLFEDADGEPGAANRLVLTHASWTRRFGADPDLVGSTIELDDQPYTVVGVTAPEFQFPPGASEMEMYFPMRLNDQILLDRDHRMFDGIARVTDGWSLAAAQAELDSMGKRLAAEFPRTNEGWGLRATPIRTEVLGDLAPTLWVLSGAALLVLIIACANINNVLLARSTAAEREFAVRAALGAGRRQLLLRSLTESGLLGGAGWLLGVLVALVGVTLLRAFLPQDIPRADSLGVEGPVLAFAALLSLAATALFGSLPALRSMAPDLIAGLKPSGASVSSDGRGRRVREAMVVVEVALAIVLLVGAGLLVRSFQRLGDVQPGFRAQGVSSMSVKLPNTRYGRAEWPRVFDRLVERAALIPGVDAAGAVSDLPMSSVGLDFEMEFAVPDLEAPPAVTPNADFRLVVPGYFEAMDMKLAAGSTFGRLEPGRRRNIAVVNQALVDRVFGDIDPIGRTIQPESAPELRIVGVVSDVKHNGLQSKYESEVYLPFGDPIATTEMHLVVHSDLGSDAISASLREVLREVDPQLAPGEIVLLSDLLWESVARPRFNMALLLGLSLCALVLALVGVYGVVAFGVSLRRGEIGVRMALGADSLDTVGMVVRQAVAALAAGAAAGVVLSIAASRLLSGLLFETRAVDPATYGIVVFGALAVGILAALGPARRAVRIDPVAALRGD